MEYFQSPNIPNKCSEGIIIDYNVSEDTLNELHNIGIKVLYKTQQNSGLYDAVSTHADMQIFHVGGNRFITAPENYIYYKSILTDAEIIKGSQYLSDKYPYDIYYNSAAFGNMLICNARYTSSEILSEYKASSRKILSVKQGYAKCSICIVDDNAIITADESIYKTALQNKIDVLKIRTGFIKLKNMNYGFIGGATGLTAPDILAVNGDIKTHPDFRNIIDFCKNHKVNVYSLKKGIMEDIGSILPVF